MRIADLDKEIDASYAPYGTERHFSQEELREWDHYGLTTWDYFSPAIDSELKFGEVSDVGRFMDILAGRTNCKILESRFRVLHFMNEEGWLRNQGPGDNVPWDFLVPMFLYENRIDRILHELFTSTNLEATVLEIMQAACAYMFRLRWLGKTFETFLVQNVSLRFRGRVLKAKCDLLYAILELNPKASALFERWRSACEWCFDVWLPERRNFYMRPYFKIPYPHLRLGRFLLARNAIPTIFDNSKRCVKYFKRIEDLDLEVLYRFRNPEKRGRIKEDFLVRLLRENERIDDYLMGHRYKGLFCREKELDSKFFRICITELSAMFWRRFGKEWSTTRDTRPDWIRNGLKRPSRKDGKFVFGGPRGYRSMTVEEYALNLSRKEKAHV